MSHLSLIATASFGLEAVVARELKQLGYTDQTVEDGRVTFTADEAAICRTNLWLRSADRVMVQLGSFDAHDFGELFDQTKALPWSDWLTDDATFPVRGKSIRSQLSSVPDCQAIVKKAIVEQLKQTYRQDWFEETGPKFSVEVSLLKDRVTLAIDTTGPGLHKRGYRTLTGLAPLKETLSAALVQLSHWNRERPLIDPFCGTGTILTEAALIGLNRAPGRRRSFDSEDWPRVGSDLWTQARTEADDLEVRDAKFTLIGHDRDGRVLKSARHHAEQAGVEDYLYLQQQNFAELTTRRKFGCVICNPPYGERSGPTSDAEQLSRDMAQVFKGWDTWSIYVLTAVPRFERLFGRRADRRRKLYNGRIECTYFQFPGPRPPWLASSRSKSPERDPKRDENRPDRESSDSSS